MPYYDFHCDQCHHEQTSYRKISERDLPSYHCGQQLRRVISAPAIRPDIQSYISPASGKLISSRAQRVEDMAREGCIPNEPGIKEHIASRAESVREKAFAPLAASIDQTVSALCASGHI